MWLTKDSIVRCRCGQELSSLRELKESDGDQHFYTQRCATCGEVTVVRSDGAVMPMR